MGYPLVLADLAAESLALAGIASRVGYRLSCERREVSRRQNLPLLKCREKRPNHVRELDPTLRIAEVEHLRSDGCVQGLALAVRLHGQLGDPGTDRYLVALEADHRVSDCTNWHKLLRLATRIE